MLLFSSDTNDRNFVFAQCYISATAALEHLTPQIFTNQSASERAGQRASERCGTTSINDKL